MSCLYLLNVGIAGLPLCTQHQTHLLEDLSEPGLGALDSDPPHLLCYQECVLRVIFIKPLHHLGMKPSSPKHKHRGVGTYEGILPPRPTSLMQTLL